MKVKNRLSLLILIFILLFLSACQQTEFSCEDTGGKWIDETCIKATVDAGLVCNDNSECDGYCYTTKHPKALTQDQLNGFAPTGICSTHQLPITCANSIDSGNIIEICREN